MTRVDLVITTYNWPSALDRVLASAKRLNRMPDRIIIADDGSGPSTAQMLEHWRGEFGGRLVHSWHEDLGFRAGAARNRAVLQGDSDLIVFLDGDCMMRPDFIDAHLALAERGWTVAGHRILLARTLTQQILDGAQDPLSWPATRWWRARSEREVARIFPLLTIPGRRWRHLRPRNWLQFRGCNVSVWRSDFDAVNGFEEQLTGWGFEDSDLAIRLLASGVRIKSGRFATAVLHLWHTERERTRAEQNRQHALQVARQGTVSASMGLQQRREGALSSDR